MEAPGVGNSTRSRIVRPTRRSGETDDGRRNPTRAGRARTPSDRYHRRGRPRRPVRPRPELARQRERDAGLGGHVRDRVPRAHAPQEHVRVGRGHARRAHRVVVGGCAFVNALEIAEMSDGSDNAYGALAVRLFAARLLYPMGVTGLYGRSATYQSIIDAIDEMVVRWGHSLGAERMHFPPVIARSTFDHTNYLQSFPHLM